MPMCRWRLSLSTRRVLHKAVCHEQRNTRCLSLCRRPTFRLRPMICSRPREWIASAFSSRAGSGYCEEAQIPAEQTDQVCSSPFISTRRPARLLASASRYRFPKRQIRQLSITRSLGPFGRMEPWEIGVSARRH
ncbi:hypothetical protein SDC9_204807 [bioreactor metagenome]|uniref:Uncharacterized protein n=1 Tax=bioreactor metagenome TaxID=1076179 RepID=A0A645JC48_9ZZZZ